MRKPKWIELILFMVFIFSGLLLQAEESTVFNSEDLVIAKVAQERSYPGGSDENEIEVQTPLIKPHRKIGSEKENIEVSPNDDEF